MKLNLLFIFFVLLINAPNLFSQDLSRDTTVNEIKDDQSVSLKVITPPNGFLKTELFHGYLHQETSCSMLIQEVKNANYLTLSQSMTENFFADNNLRLIEKTELLSENQTNGMVYKFEFVMDEMSFVRYMVFAGELNGTLWINVTFPKKNEILLDKLINKSFSTIQYPLSE